MSDPDDAQVTYSVRDLLAEIKADQSVGFTRLETALNGKADAADVARLEERVDHQGKRIAVVEQTLHDGTVTGTAVAATITRRWSRRRQAAAVAGSVATLAAMILGPYIAQHGL